MGKTVAVKVTPKGVLVPRRLVPAWDEVQEVEVEQREDALIIRPRSPDTRRPHAEIVREMKAAGLVEDLGWALPPAVPAEERARLAWRLAEGQPLSEIVIEERAERL